MRTSEKSRALCAASTLALITSLVSLPQAVRAADAADTAKESSGGATTIGEIIVTAQKREQNLQTVPVAITAFTAAERDRAGIVSAQSQMNFTPGVTYDPQSDHLDIRGVGKVTTYIGTDPGVAVYTDGFYVGSANQLNTSTLETERVEVLRGPQGTLYGRNSIGGAVNQISRRPDNEFTGEIRASANNWNGYNIEARVSGPITDWLKASAYFEGNDQTGSYFHSVAPHTAPAAPAMPGDSTRPATPAYPAATCDSLNFATVQPMTCGSFNNPFPGTGGVGNGWIGSFQAAYNPSPKFDGWVNARFTNQFSRPDSASITTPWNPIALTVPSVFYGFQGIQQPGLYNPFDTTRNIPTTDYYDSRKFVTQDTYHAPGFDVRFVGGYWDYKDKFIQDGDAVPDPVSGVYEPTYAALNGAAPYPFPTINPKDPQSTVIDPNQLNNGYQTQFQAWSTELDFASTTSGKLQWLAGAYYYNERNYTLTGYQEIDTPVYDNVTDYLFAKQGCLPFAGNVATGGSCAFGVPVSVLGGNPLSPTSPSTVNNNPGGALNQLMGQLGPNGQTVPGSGCLYCTQADLKTQSEALFGQLDYSPNSQWHFTGGIRYSWDQKQGYEQEIDVYWIPLVATQAQAQAFGFPQYPSNWPVVNQRGQYVQDFVGTSCSSPSIPPLNGVTPLNSTTPCPGHRNIVDHWAAPTGTASVSWTPNSDTNVYAKYSRGYKSGGFNLGALVAGTGEVGPEYINDYEGGWKQNFFNGTFQTNMAVFYYQYYGLQANNATVQNSSPAIVINELVNIQNAHAWGVELETKWRPIENLLVLFNYSYLNAVNDTSCTITGSGDNIVRNNCFIDSANPGAATVVNGQTLTGVKPVGPPIIVSGLPNQPQSLKGNALPYSPANKISANVSYTFHFQPGDLTFSAVENYHTSYYDSLFSTQEWLVQNGYSTDFRVTWAAHSGKYQIIGTVSNAFDALVETAYTTLPPSNAYYAFNNLEDPRIFTLEVRYHF